MKIAGIIFAVVAVLIIGWALVNWVKGWQDENEVDPTKMPMPDDMERADRDKARKKQFRA